MSVRDTEIELIRRAQQGETSARNELIEMHLPYIWKTAQTTGAPQMETEELVHVGVLALARCIKKIDLSKGFRLLTYATKAIRSDMRKAVQNGRLIRVTECGRKSESTKADCQRADSLVSLDVAVGGDQLPLSSFIEARDVDIPLQAERAEQIERLRQCISRLPKQQQKTIQLRLEGWTLGEVGQEFGVTRSRAQQVEQAALERLRSELVGPPAETSESQH